MKKSLLKTIQNNAAVISGSLLLFGTPVVLSNCAGIQVINESNRLGEYLEKNNEIRILNDYHNDPTEYGIVLERERRALLDNPKFEDYDIIMLHRYLQEKGINYFDELQKYIADKSKPEFVNSVIKHLEW